MNLLIKNIKQLVTVPAHGKRFKAGQDMRDLGIIENATVLIENGKFLWIGRDGDFLQSVSPDIDVIDAANAVALPGFVDSHTHTVFAEIESLDASYENNLLQTVQATRDAAKKDLKKSARHHLDAMLRAGTTTVEIKSGYGLNERDEIKMMDTINELKNEHFIDIVPTFFGAHAIPPEYVSQPDAYIDFLCTRLLPYLSQRKIASFCDVSCQRGYFSLEQSKKLLLAAQALGIGSKIHADQFSAIGASKLAGELLAVSADHLDKIDDAGIQALNQSSVVATVLPGVSFFLNYGYPPARKIIDAGVPLALASNFNPCSCMSHSIPMMMTIACTQMLLTPEEAITAATLNGAAALNLSKQLGSIELGKQADMVLYQIPNYRYLIDHFGTNFVWKIIKRGVHLEF